MKRVVLALVVLVPLAVSAEVLRLKDGSSLNGKVVSQKGGAVTFKTDIGTITVPESKIASIDFGAAATPAPSPAATKPPATATAVKRWDGWYYATLPLGLPKASLRKLVPAVQGAAAARKHQAYPIDGGVQVNVAKDQVIRYWTRGAETVDAELSFGVKNPADVAAVEARLRAIHEELYRDAKGRSEEAKAFETTAAPARGAFGVALGLFDGGASKGAGNEKLPYCQNHLDCGSGEFCKDRGDGLRLCMGNGGQGDYCADTTDCEGVGLWCKDRGDGLTVCMGNGAKGDACTNNTDCDGVGLWCKDRGDGIHVCM